MKKIWGLALLLAIAGAAHGQVHKCVAGGKTVYSEQPCSAEQRGGQMLGRSATEMDPERDAYTARLHRESLNRTMQQNREAIDGPLRAAREEPEYEAERPVASAPVRPTASPGGATSCDTWTSRKGCIGGSRATNPNWAPGKGYTGGSSPEDRQRDERDRLEAERVARLKPRPTNLTNCDAGGCWDNVGNRYNNIGGQAGSYVRTDGKVCRPNGDMITCN